MVDPDPPFLHHLIKVIADKGAFDNIRDIRLPKIMLKTRVAVFMNRCVDALISGVESQTGHHLDQKRSAGPARASDDQMPFLPGTSQIHEPVPLV